MTHLEAEYWEQIRGKLPGFVQRIETSTGNGVPDVFGCYRGKPYWVELKVWQPGTGILLRKEQWAWANNYAQHGGTSFVLVRSEIQGVSMLFTLNDLHVTAYGSQNKYVIVQVEKTPRRVSLENKILKGTLIKFLFP